MFPLKHFLRIDLFGKSTDALYHLEIRRSTKKISLENKTNMKYRSYEGAIYHEQEINTTRNFRQIS